MSSLDRTKLHPNLEPPSIAELATALQDASWLDMRVVDAGSLQRVRIECLHIYRERDVVTVSQNYRVTPNTVGMSQCTMDVDCEDIMYIIATETESVDDVSPLEAPKDPLPEIFELIKESVVAATVAVTGGTIVSLVKAMEAGHGRFNQDVINRRHLVLWALIEMTDLTPYRLCHECGWRSPMPFQTARYKFTGPHAEEKWLKVITQIVSKTREIGSANGGANWRRDDDNSWREICLLP